MNKEVQKALKWIIRSDIFTIALFSLATLVDSYAKSEIDFRLLSLAILVLVVRTTANLLDYWRHETSK